MRFITQLKIEFLLPFTGCTKVLGKIPVNAFNSVTFYHFLLPSVEQLIECII